MHLVREWNSIVYKYIGLVVCNKLIYFFFIKSQFFFSHLLNWTTLNDTKIENNNMKVEKRK